MTGPIFPREAGYLRNILRLKEDRNEKVSIYNKAVAKKERGSA